MYRSHIDAEDYNLWKDMQIIEDCNLCTNAKDLWKLEHQCHFKHGSNPAHFVTFQFIYHINNMIINVINVICIMSNVLLMSLLII